MFALPHEFNWMVGTERNEYFEPEISILLPVGQSNPLPVLIYKILLKHGRTQVMVYYVWLLLHYGARVE